MNLDIHASSHAAIAPDSPEPTTRVVWDERRAAVLLGFQEAAEIPATGPEEPAITDDRLLEADPTRLTQPDPNLRDAQPVLSLGQNPLARLGFVGSVSLAGFVLVGLFFSSMTQGGNRPHSSRPTPATEKTAVETATALSPEQQTAELLTEAALSKQEGQLAALSKTKLDPTPIKPADPAGKKESATPTSIAPATPIRPPITPVPLSAPVTMPQPPALAWNRPSVPLPPIAPAAPLPTVPVNPVNPEQQWLTASTIGSYNLTSGSQSNLNDSAPPTPSPPIAPIASTATQAVNSAEEAPILTGRPLQSLVIGSEVDARLVTPIVGEERAATGTTGMTQPLQFIARLEQPLLNPKGEVVFPVGTALIAEVGAIGPSGLVSLRVVAAVTNDVQYPLPAQAIGMRAGDGKPLIAQKLQDKGAEMAGLDMALVLFGGLSKVGEIWNRPQSTTLMTNLGTATTVTQNPAPNLAAAALEGGFSVLSKQVATRNQQVIQSTIARPNLWFIDQGTPVKVFVAQPIQL